MRFSDVLRRGRSELRVVVELTERHLLSRPGELLAFVDWVRRQGWGLALDDVGVDTQSIAALPFLDPDFVKLDMSLVQDDPTPDQARTVTALLAFSERTGAALLAEGIENERHLEQAPRSAPCSGRVSASAVRGRCTRPCRRAPRPCPRSRQSHPRPTRNRARC